MHYFHQNFLFRLMHFQSRFYSLFSKSFIKLSHSQGFISAFEFFRIGHSACKNQTVKVRFIDYGCTTLTKTRRRFVVEIFIFIINMHCKHSAVIHNWCSEYIPLILMPKNQWVEPNYFIQLKSPPTIYRKK